MLDGRFALRSEAGRGALGTVFRATDLETEDPVAVKILRHRGQTDLSRFERESRILAELDDPGIVRYVAHGRADDGAPYLVMEWLEGETLSDYLQRERPALPAAVDGLASVCDALSHAHARPGTHR